MNIVLTIVTGAARIQTMITMLDIVVTSCMISAFGQSREGKASASQESSPVSRADIEEGVSMLVAGSMSCATPFCMAWCGSCCLTRSTLYFRSLSLSYKAEWKGERRRRRSRNHFGFTLRKFCGC